MSAREPVRFAQPLRSVKLVAAPAAASGPKLDADAVAARERAAYEKGFAEASAGISQQLLDQRAEVNELRARLFQSLEANVTQAVAEVRAALPVLTLQALRRVLARTEITRDTVTGIIDELLAEIGPDVGPIEVRLHPADLRLVEDLEPQLARLHPGLRFVADEAMTRGDSEAVTRYGKVDARMENKLAKIEASLAPHP